MKRIKEPIEIELNIKKSRFITMLYPIGDESDAKHLINTIKEQHPKANHHCVAYVIQKDRIARFDDDGEPSHTAGKPMLNVLLQQNIDHVLAITIRYFGGVKLGKGGLVKAYTQGVANALSEAVFLSLKQVIIVAFSCPLKYASQVEAYSHHAGQLIDYDHDEVHAFFVIKLVESDDFIKKIKEMTKGSASITSIENRSE